MPQRHRKFGPSDGGVPPRSRRPFGLYFVPYIIEPYHIIIIKRNDNKFLSNLCFIQNQHRPLKFTLFQYVIYRKSEIYHSRTFIYHITLILVILDTERASV